MIKPLGNRKKEIFGCIMAILAFVLLLIRSKYGFSYDDEPFLLTLTQRLYYGDSLFIDEWNFAQNVAVLLLPFYRVYIALFGSVDGIILVFRGLYCFFWVLTCTIVYTVLSKKYKMAWVVYFYLLLFSPLDQMILSYTSIGLMCILLLGTLFVRHTEIKAMKLWPFTILFSVPVIIAVIASPYLGFVYATYVGGCVVVYLWKRNETTAFFMKSALWSVVIAIGALLLYVWRFVLNNYSVAEVIEKLPNMFANSSITTNITERSNSLVWSVVQFWRYQLFVSGMTFVATLIPKIRKSTICRILLLSANVLVFGYEMLQQFGNKGGIPYFNLQMAPIVFLGYTAWWLLYDKKTHRWLVAVFSGLGASYALVSYISSDTGLPAFCMGLTACGVTAILMIWQLVQELVKDLRSDKDEAAVGAKILPQKLCVCFCIALTMVVFALQIFTQSYQKANRHYWDCTVPEMDGKVTVGASDGVYTLQRRAYEYDERMKALEELLQYVKMDEKQKIRFLSLVFDPDVYLNAELPVGCYSTWSYSKADDGAVIVKEKMDRYYSVNPNKIPTVIFVSEAEEWDCLLLPDIDITGYEEVHYGGYALYIAPELVKK